MSNSSESEEFGMSSSGSTPPSSKRPRKKLIKDFISVNHKKTENEIQVPETDENILKWDIGKFIKIMENVPGSSRKVVKCYQSPKLGFKELKWYIEIYPIHYEVSTTKPRPPINVNQSKDMNLCVLYVQNSCEDTKYELDLWLTISTKSSNSSNAKEMKDKVELGDQLAVLPGQTVEALHWHEEENTLFDPGEPLTKCWGWIKATIFILYPYDAAQGGKFTKQSQIIIDTMRQMANEIQFFNNWTSNKNSNGPKEDFWIEGSVGAKKIGFHKCVLQLRGGNVLNALLATEMKESRTGQMKMENYDEEIIRGFRNYLYNGTIPNISTHAIEYFEFGAQYELELIQELAELECCKQLDPRDLNDVFRIAKLHKTKYLKDEIINVLEKDPSKMKKIIRKNFEFLEEM